MDNSFQAVRTQALKSSTCGHVRDYDKAKLVWRSGCVSGTDCRDLLLRTDSGQDEVTAPQEKVDNVSRDETRAT